MLDLLLYGFEVFAGELVMKSNERLLLESALVDVLIVWIKSCPTSSKWLSGLSFVVMKSSAMLELLSLVGDSYVCR